MVIYRTKSREQLMTEARAAAAQIKQNRGQRDPRFKLLEGITAFCGPVLTQDEETTRKALLQSR